MKKKIASSDLREVRLTIRITQADLDRLERLRTLVNPYGNKESKAKAVSAAMFLAEQKLTKGIK